MASSGIPTNDILWLLSLWKYIIQAYSLVSIVFVSLIYFMLDLNSLLSVAK